MSWVYWGIVSGVAALVALLFVCLDLVSAGGKPSREESRRVTGKPVDVGKPSSATGRRAA